MKENKCNGYLLSPAGSHGSIAGSRATRQWEDKQRETENGRCWLSYIESHPRVSRSWGNGKSGFWSRGTGQKGWAAFHRAFWSSLFSSPNAVLKIRHTPILSHIPAVFVSNFFFHGFPDFLPSFMSMHTFMTSNTQAYANFRYSCCTFSLPPVTQLRKSLLQY